MHTAVVDVTLQLTTALLLVRLGVYLLRIVLGPDSWIRAWETRITFLAWLVIGFELVGWFDAFERGLDSIDLLPGTKTFSLWDLLRGIIVTALFVIITSLIARTIERRVMKLDALAVSTRIGISKFTYFFLLSLGILLGINAAGVDIAALTVLTGAIGLGLGFGLQAIASNFVSGFVLLMDKSIKPGDVISFTGTTGTSTENFGWVQELRGRYVVVRDRDGVETLVPNQNLITNSVINWSYSDQRVRIRLPVMVSYDSDPEAALRVLLDAARNHPRILREPNPVSRLMSFEDYGMRCEVRFWIADPMNGVNNVRSDVNRAIWRLFKENGIRIPVAQREIRILEGPSRQEAPRQPGQGGGDAQQDDSVPPVRR
jgi:small-conductance mechanosensitive channel